MDHKQSMAPLYEKLIQFKETYPISFHVPGHKNGQVFADIGMGTFHDILTIDFTELNGLDDLHAPTGIIREAQDLAAEWFGAKQTYFLVGGSTVGNLAMILATCSRGEEVIVQRNSHKSIINGLELSGAKPIFIAPDYDAMLNRYTGPNIHAMKKAIDEHPDSKAVIVTYPDYWGSTYNLKEIIDYAHKSGMPVLVDEAHGVHFRLANLFPSTALELGADVVVQSAHKMAPAMTMASYLHVSSNLIQTDKMGSYLSVLQSSSPSYPLLASLDLARFYLAQMTKREIIQLDQSINKVRKLLQDCKCWEVLPTRVGLDDPLKITIQIKKGFDINEVIRMLEQHQLYYELASHNQILFIHGLERFMEIKKLEHAIENINEQLKFHCRNATIEERAILFNEKIKKLNLSYEQMKEMSSAFLKWADMDDHYVAESVIPYPPGIPILIRGEQVTNKHMEMINYLIQQGVTFQNKDIQYGLKVFLAKENV